MVRSPANFYSGRVKWGNKVRTRTMRRMKSARARERERERKRLVKALCRGSLYPRAVVTPAISFNYGF